MLAQTLEWARGGHGQIVALIGEAGVGKSRLVYEFVRSHHTQGWLVLESASVSYGRAASYFPIIDLLKRYILWCAKMPLRHRLLKTSIMLQAATMEQGQSRAVHAWARALRGRIRLLKPVRRLLQA